MEYYSIIRKNEMMLFRNMDGLRDYHTKWDKPDREKYHMMIERLMIMIYSCMVASF